MIDDLIFQVRAQEYKQWFLDYVEWELKKCNLSCSMYNIIKIFQVIELDLLETSLFNEYSLVFIKFISNELDLNSKIIKSK